MAAFRGMHVSPVKHSHASVTDGQTDGRTDRQTYDGQSDPYVSLCFAGDTKIGPFRFDDTLTKKVACLHEPQPNHANVLQKVRQNTFLELS